jgi:hypothetical protein
METDRKIKEGDRVYDHTRPNRQGTLLRIETYPGTGPKKWATVNWDDCMSARRVEPTCLRRSMT